MNPKKVNILLIEDNSSDVRIIQEFLKSAENFHYNIDVCSRLSEGLNLFKEKRFDVILLDLTLPDSDINNTLETVLDLIVKIPIIILTGLDDKKFALNSLKKGAQDYLVKGELNKSILTRSILYAIERHRVEEEVKEKAQAVQLDNKGKEILNILQDNYRISYKELSEKVNLAASTIHNRVQNMLEEGIIRAFDTLIDPFKVGYNTIAILGLTVDTSKMKEIASKISTYDEVQLVASTTGDHDIIVQVIKKTEKDLWRFINENLRTIDGVMSQMDVSSFIDIYKMTHKIKFKIKE